jgi:hypothetical protein
MSHPLTILGDTHSVLYWLVFTLLITGVIGLREYFRRKGLAKKFDYAMLGVWVAILIFLLVAWRIVLWMMPH